MNFKHILLGGLFVIATSTFAQDTKELNKEQKAKKEAYEKADDDLKPRMRGQNKKLKEQKEKANQKKGEMKEKHKEMKEKRAELKEERKELKEQMKAKRDEILGDHKEKMKDLSAEEKKAYIKENPELAEKLKALRGERKETKELIKLKREEFKGTRAEFVAEKIKNKKTHLANFEERSAKATGKISATKERILKQKEAGEITEEQYAEKMERLKKLKND